MMLIIELCSIYVNNDFASSMYDLIYEIWFCSIIFVALTSLCWPLEAGVLFDFNHLQVQQVVGFNDYLKAEYWNVHGLH